MDTSAAIKVSYWEVQRGPRGLDELEGLEEFKDALSEHYVSVVHGRPGDLGGGLYELAVEFVASISLASVAKFLLGGVAFDLVKAGTKGLVLRPFLRAYEKLRDRNKAKGVDIEELRITFQDSSLVLHKISPDGIFSGLEQIMHTLAASYDFMRLDGSEPPFEIHIPVFEDPAEDRLCRFRVMLDVDETITDISAADYLKYWGLYYDYARTFRVYDVQRRLLIDSEFYTLDRYWQEWEVRSRRSGGNLTSA